MIMENEQKISYEELANAYQNVILQLNQLQMQLAQCQTDRTTDKLKVLMDIIKDKSVYSENIVELAEWHITNILKKPNTEND